MTSQNPFEKKLSQLIIRRLDGERVRSASYRKHLFECIEQGIGGFILFGGERKELCALIEEMQSAAEIPLFIAADVERGVGQQIHGCAPFPCQMAVSAGIDRTNPDDVRLLQQGVLTIVEDTRDMGINMPLIPVLDVNQDPDNPIICTRAFSDNPQDVEWFGMQYIEILERAGLISCAKHFPGHGDTSADSHILLPVISKSYEELMAVDILPFKGAVAAGVSSIMVGHLHIPSVDSVPSSLSKRIITDILRRQLGFEGIVVTDALNMHAVSAIEDVSVHCVQAGVDILLHPADPDITVKELMTGLSDHRIAEEQIETAFGRIRKAKTNIRNRMQKGIVPQTHKSVASIITQKSISLVKDAPGLLPITARRAVRFIVAGTQELSETSPFHSSYKSSLLTDTESTAENDICIFMLFTHVAAWRGSSGIPDDDRQRIQRLIRKARHSVVISFGSPYVLRHFPEADMLIAAYEATDDAQTAVMRCLEGRKGFQGRLPVGL